MSPGAHAEALRELGPYEYEFFVLLNEHRAAHGVGPVRAERVLNQVARDYAAFMAETGCFDHTACDGKEPWDRMCAGGYEPACSGTDSGENIAAGQWSGRDVFEAWRESPGHNENMLRPNYRVVGIGRVETGDDRLPTYWVNVFAGTPTEETYDPEPPAGLDGGVFDGGEGDGGSGRRRRRRPVGCVCSVGAGASPWPLDGGWLGLLAWGVLWRWRRGRRERGLSAAERC